MKVVIGGATGYVGTEVVRQALGHPLITAVVALGRHETQVPKDVDPQIAQSKFISVACSDFITYPPNVRTAISDADACIWCVKVQTHFVNTI